MCFGVRRVSLRQDTFLKDTLPDLHVPPFDRPEDLGGLQLLRHEDARARGLVVQDEPGAPPGARAGEPGGGIFASNASREPGSRSPNRPIIWRVWTVSGRRASLKSTFLGFRPRNRGIVSTSSWFTLYTGG